MTKDCGYVPDGALGHACGWALGIRRRWLIFVSTPSRTELDEPLVRCDAHLAPTIARVLEGDRYLLRDVRRAE